jgi:hypothetical protein
MAANSQAAKFLERFSVVELGESSRAEHRVITPSEPWNAVEFILCKGRRIWMFVVS